MSGICTPFVKAGQTLPSTPESPLVSVLMHDCIYVVQTLDAFSICLPRLLLVPDSPTLRGSRNTADVAFVAS